KLPCDVGVETNEMQAAFPRIRRPWLKSIRRRKTWAILASTPYQAVETSRRHQIVATSFASKSECVNQVRNRSLHARWKVSITRIGATNVRSERTAHAVGIAVVSKLVIRAIFFVVAGAVYRIFLGRHERRTFHRSTNHRFRQSFTVFGILSRRVGHVLPEAANVLFQLSHHEIRAVACEIFFLRLVQRGKQFRSAATRRIEQRAISVFVVLIRISEDKLTERNDIAVRKLVAVDLALPFPIDGRLTDAIDKTKRFNLAQVTGVETFQHFESNVP